MARKVPIINIHNEELVNQALDKIQASHQMPENARKRVLCAILSVFRGDMVRWVPEDQAPDYAKGLNGPVQARVRTEENRADTPTPKPVPKTPPPPREEEFEEDAEEPAGKATFRDEDVAPRTAPQARTPRPRPKARRPARAGARR